ncbi:SHD1 domain-containing protein [Neorhodopirellula pilleata]|uniref:WD domain, G-beta repeat n=1 Tax=Neorhodopirellula pilleata TaxID=2714738 RepID=A0A5C6APC5_9BACT|nr:SHD1 domain-containing protein [Neorhodopirellula pilleata]TWU01530.1 WD domain, G-beta repeat [Neorhodopirellula pilleata]
MIVPKILRTFCLGCMLVVLDHAVVQARTWTDATGTFKAEAELVAVRDGKAYLERPDGRVNTVPLKRLSVEDLKFIASIPQYAALVKPLLQESDRSPEPALPSPKIEPNQVDTPSASGSIRQFRSDSWGYNGLAFSNDGAFLVTLGSDNVTVINIKASTKTTYRIHSGNRSALTFTPDGKRLIVGGYDGRALIWQFDGEGTLKPDIEFPVDAGEIKSVVVSPDNQHVLTMHSTGTACLWNASSGEVYARFRDFKFSSCSHARFSRQGGQAMITDGRIAAVIDIPSRKIIQRMPLTNGSGQVAVIAPDGNAISVDRTYDFHTIETQTVSPVVISKGTETHWSAAYSPDGKRLVSGGLSKVKLWNVETGMPVRSFEMGDSGYVKYVAFSPDGLHFAAIGAPIGKLVEIFRMPSEE